MTKQSLEIPWETAQKILDDLEVDEILRNFLDDPTNDGGVILVRQIIKAYKNTFSDWLSVKLEDYREVHLLTPEEEKDLLKISEEARVKFP